MKSRLLVPLLLVLIASSSAVPQETAVIRADTAAGIAYNNPAWSPDGKSIAYVAYPTGCEENGTGREIRIARLAAGQWKSKVLVKNADFPLWSPNGKRLAFNRSCLTILDLASGVSAGKNATKPYPLGWSPNSRYILCGSSPDKEPAAIMDMKTGKTLPSPVGPESAWMADGKLLTSVAGDLRILDPATGKSRNVAKGVRARRPFIPRGASYAWLWITENAPKGEGIYRVDLKTGALTKQIAVHAKELYWSPTGKQFAFIADWSPRAGVEALSCVYVGSTLNWRFKIASKNALRADDDMHSHLAWSPDGRKIAFVTAEGGISVLKP